MKVKSLLTYLLEATRREDPERIGFLVRQKQIKHWHVPEALEFAARDHPNIKVLTHYPHLTQQDLPNGIANASQEREGVGRLLLEARPSGECSLGSTWLDGGLQIAAAHSNNEIMRLLLNAGANAGAVLSWGGLPLFNDPSLESPKAGLALCPALARHPALTKYRAHASDGLKKFSARLNQQMPTPALDPLHACLSIVARQFGVEHQPRLLPAAVPTAQVVEADQSAKPDAKKGPA